MGGDSWGAALLRSQVRGLVVKPLKRELLVASPRVQPAEGSTQDGVNLMAFAQHLDLERWPCGPNGKRLKVGSDCSGLDFALVALEKLGLSDRVTLKF